MTLDEAIKHAEEVVEENSKSYEEWLACKNRGNVGWSKSDIEAVDKNIEQCKKCAEEHRQLAGWLKELNAHREAWVKILDEMMNVSIPGQDAEYVYQNIYDIIKKYRPKEGDTK